LRKIWTRNAKSGRIRGALHGIPVLIKDNIDTADRMKTTAGSLALLGRADAETGRLFSSAIKKIRRGNFRQNEF
jgi:amidase